MTYSLELLLVIKNLVRNCTKKNKLNFSPSSFQTWTGDTEWAQGKKLCEQIEFSLLQRGFSATTHHALLGF